MAKSPAWQRSEGKAESGGLNEKGLKGERKDAYVYGTLAKIKKAEEAKKK